MQKDETIRLKVLLSNKINIPNGLLVVKKMSIPLVMLF